ncbi:MAG: hypothetical protein K2Q20_06665, partial [Phycisphaerales bacterium]|nr:hypothetical protein [Phycisphaerales bacterium]
DYSSTPEDGVVRAARVIINGGAGAACAAPCRADFNGVGGVTVQDIFAFLSAWFARSPQADIDGQNGIVVQDIFAFLSLWFAGC